MNLLIFSTTNWACISAACSDADRLSCWRGLSRFQHFAIRAAGHCGGAFYGVVYDAEYCAGFEGLIFLTPNFLNT